jgi:hypothetical protein
MRVLIVKFMLQNVWALPIFDGVKPFLANLKMWSLTSSDDDFNHVGTIRRYGRADLEIPFLQNFIKKKLKIRVHKVLDLCDITQTTREQRSSVYCCAVYVPPPCRYNLGLAKRVNIKTKLIFTRVCASDPCWNFVITLF